MSLWRGRLIWWVPSLALLAVTAGGLLFYALVFTGALQLGGTRLERSQDRLASLQSERRQLEELLVKVNRNRTGLETLKSEWITTERQRLTRIIAEVKLLAERAGVEPQALRYPKDEFEDFHVTKKSIVFSVDGSYVELRRFINLLELSDYFLILEEVRLSERRGTNELRISLVLSTLFLDEEAPPVSSEEVARRSPT